MTKYFVIQQAHAEYNDETYSIEGYAEVESNGYLSLDDAKIAATAMLKSYLHHHHLCDFSYEPTFTPQVEEWLKMHGKEKQTHTSGNYTYSYWDDLYDLTWGDYVDWAISMGYDWIKDVPELVHISEIEFPNPCKQEANAS